MHITISLESNVTNELVAGWCITEWGKRLAGNEIELGIEIPTIESQESNIREQRMLLCGLIDKDLRRICRSQYEHRGSAIGYWPETCLGHVYIVLESVGSARLTFDDNQYYEFMWFDVPKVVWSTGWDRGHDEESRNGRDVEIDILDDNTRTSERFRVIRVFFGVSGSYGNTGKKYWASWAKWWKRGGRARGPLAQTELD